MDIVPAGAPTSSWSPATLDGFTGNNPDAGIELHARGWGCDSTRTPPGRPRRRPASSAVPSCIPDYGLDPASIPTAGRTGRRRSSTIPTIMDRLDHGRADVEASTRPGNRNGYSWAICPTFADACTPPAQNWFRRAGPRPTPRAARCRTQRRDPQGRTLQHNRTRWRGRQLDRPGRRRDPERPRLGSTAIFITYDDCGCFYDHVAPPAAARAFGCRW